MSFHSLFSLNKMYKNITLFLFFILPSKITNIFVNLSIIAVVYDIRNTILNKENVNNDKIENILNIAISEEVLLLPNYTISWFWNDNFLNTKVYIRGEEYILKNVIKDDKLFFNNMRRVIDIFIDHLPSSLKYKIGIYKVNKRILIKHNLMNIFIYS